MKTINKISVSATLSCWLILLSAANAHAYVDPTATAIVVQVVAGICISAGVAIKIFWRKIVGIFKKSGGKGD